jgi:dihydropteroate synthase
VAGGRAGATAAGRVLDLGGRRYDLATSALVMGILNRTKDSFFDKGSHFEMDRLLRRAEDLAAGGADILDIGGVKAGPGEEVGEEEELERVLPAVVAVRARFDLPISVDTWRARVVAAAFEAGAVVGNDISGFADPGYLPAAAAAGATVVATHIRLAPRVPDPDPVYADVVAEVAAFLSERAAWARGAGLPPERVIVDAGLDLGKTAGQSLLLLRASRRLAGLGHPLLVSASNKPFLGVLLGLDIDSRASASLAAAAIAIAGGARICRVHDVAATRRVRDVLAAIIAEQSA